MYHIKDDKRSIQSGEWIFEALARLMKEKEYKQITITELAEEAKLGRATFYRNFDTMDDVLRLKCDEVFAKLYEYLVDYYKTLRLSEDGGKTIFLRPFLRFWYNNSLVIELLLQANRLDIINESFEDMLKLFLASLDDSHDIIHEHLDYFISIRSGMAINILIQWIKNGKEISPDELADLLIEQIKESLKLNLLL